MIAGGKSICVIVPTYNNAGTVVKVVRSVLDYCKDVIVVNDGSTDNTMAVLTEAALSVTIVDYAANKGKGGALVEGFRKARQMGFDYAITIDSDGQHYPEDIPVFVEAIESNPGALVVGSRNLNAENMPGKNSFANKFSNFWFRVQTAKNIPDTQTGFRAYPLDRLPFLGLLTSRYEAELELLVLSAWKGTALMPVAIRVYYPPQEERVTHFRPFWDFFRISVLNTVFCVLALVYGYPRMLMNKLFARR